VIEDARDLPLALAELYLVARSGTARRGAAVPSDRRSRPAERLPGPRDRHHKIFGQILALD
jgi:hypothetical protein